MSQNKDTKIYFILFVCNNNIWTPNWKYNATDNRSKKKERKNEIFRYKSTKTCTTLVNKVKIEINGELYHINGL